jgi:hypothetical protein
MNFELYSDNHNTDKCEHDSHDFSPSQLGKFMKGAPGQFIIKSSYPSSFWALETVTKKCVCGGKSAVVEACGSVHPSHCIQERDMEKLR